MPHVIRSALLHVLVLGCYVAAGLMLPIIRRLFP